MFSEKQIGSFWVLVVKLEMGLGDNEVNGDKSKPAMNRMKKRTTKAGKLNAKVAWGKLLSQCSQVGGFLALFWLKFPFLLRPAFYWLMICMHVCKK